MKDAKRDVKMLCPLCGNDQFSRVDHDHEDMIDATDTILFRCSDCGSIYTKGELIEANTEALENAKQELIDDVLKDLKRRFSKWR